MKSIIKIAGKKIALRSLRKSIKKDACLIKAYGLTKELFPDLKNHYTGEILNDFLEEKIRFLLSAQACFVSKNIEGILKEQEKCSFIDIGDSDGSLQLMVKKLVKNNNLSTCGLNLQSEAVKKIKAKGLEAIRANASEISNLGMSYDVVAVMETIEHLPDPIGFLQSLREIVGKFLVISVPYLKQSKVSLEYLNPKVFGERKPTIENVHIFELSPKDWKKIFLHSGWRVSFEKIAFQYPKKSLLSSTKYFWRDIDYEGFWLSSFIRDDSLRGKYSVE